jgi:hypothetical protein
MATSRATAARIAENRAAALANRQVQIDVATFIQWLDARQHHDPQLADFYRTRFRPEFKPAFRELARDEAIREQGGPTHAIRPRRNTA